MNIKVSVIVPNYNHDKYLDERLASVFNQTFQDFEVILLDDASTDMSPEILSKFKDHPKVTHCLVNEENSGSPFAQWSKGISLASGDFIWIAESDDFCEPDFLESQLNTIGTASAVVSKTIVVDVTGAVLREHVHPVFHQGNTVELSGKDFLRCPISNVSAVLFRNSFANGFTNLSFHEHNILGDKFFYLEAFEGKTIVFNPFSISYYRLQSHSVSSLKHKSMTYFDAYFKEHLKFLSALKSKNKSAYGEIRKSYIKKYFNKIRNRVSREEKMSLGYFKLFLKYKYFLNFA